MVAIVTGNGFGLERSSASVLGSRGTLGSAALGRNAEGATVNAANGNLILSNIDEILIGRGPDAVFNRTYNSLGQYSGDTDNWLWGTQRKVEQVNGTTLKLTDWDGSETLFAWDAAFVTGDGITGAFVSKAGGGAYDFIIFNSTSNVWRYTDGDSHLVDEFDVANSGRIKGRSDLDGSIVTYSYSNGKLNTVTTTTGGSANYVQYNWNATTGLLDTMTTYTAGSTGPSLIRVRYGYDTLSRLTSVTVDLSPDDKSVADTRVFTTSYSYVSSTAGTPQSKLISSITKTDGTRVDFSYDGSNRVSSFTHWVDASTSRTTSFSYGSANTTITDPQGNFTTMYFDGAGQLTTLQEPAALTGGNPKITEFYYDGNGNLTNVYVFDGWGGPAIARDWYRYAANGNLDDRYQWLDGGYQVTRYSYGAKNELLSETTFQTLDLDGHGGADPTGAMITRYIYDDGNNNLVRDDGTTYTTTDSADIAENHLRFAVSAAGRVTEYRYNATGQKVAAIDYTGQLYSGTVFTEKALADWVAATNKTQTQRTDTTYDTRGNVSTVTSYEKTNSSGSGLAGANDNFTRTTYVYDQFGNLLSKLTNDSTIAETYAYDGLGRVIRFTDQAGVGTWTSYIDSQNRTVTTLASGLTTTAVYNRTGELVSSIEARGGPTREGIAASLSSWTNSSVTASSAGTVDGAAAMQLTVAGTQSGQSQSINLGGGNASAGDSITAAISLQATATSNSADLGIYGGVTGWGTNNVASARIISGPGALSQNIGGIWHITGLSTTEATRIEIIRNFTQAESFYVPLYPDYPAGGRLGTSILASAPTIAVGRYDVNPAEIGVLTTAFNLANWSSGATTSSAGTFSDGSPAMQYLVPVGGQQTSFAIGFNVNAGDTYTQTITLKGAGGGTTASLGLYSSIDDWGRDFGSGTARIISGPGTLTVESSYYNNLWNITGLSATQETRIEITRTYSSTQTGGIYVYPGRPAGYPVNQGVIAGAPSLVRTPGSQTVYKYDSLGLLRIKTDPVGTKTFYFYDRAGHKVADVDQDGSVIEYKYDAADRLIASIAYANPSPAPIASLYDGYGNPTAVEFSSVRPTTNGSDRWAWNIYDKAGRLIETIDAAGAVQQMEYDGAGRLTRTTRYRNTLAVGGFPTNPPAALVLPAVDTANDRIVKYFYDKDGLLRGTLDEENFFTETKYDAANRKTETIRYTVAAPLVAIANDIFSGVTPTAATDIRNYWIYDGRGTVIATIDGEGNVTRFAYTAAGDLAQEVRGQQVTPNTSYTMTTLPAVPAGTVVETTNYTYSVLRQLAQRQRLLSNGHSETTAYGYNSLGKLVTEATSETVSTEIRRASSRYDAKGRLIATLNGNGVEAGIALGANPTQAQIDAIYATYGTRYVYDAADRMIAKITPDGSGATGNKTLYYYDSDGQLRFELTENKFWNTTTGSWQDIGYEITEHRYNVLGDKTDSISYGSRLAATTVAGWTGGLLSPTVANTVAAIANTTLDSRHQFAYTNRSELSFIYNPLYIANPNPENYSEHLYTPFGETTKNLYHLKSDLPLYDITDIKFNRRGLQSSTSRYLNYPQNIGTNGFNINIYDYDAFGRVANAYENATDYRGASYGYDRANRLVKEWEEAGALGSYRQTGYDSLNNKISYRDRTGNITTFTYDITDKDGNAIAAGNRAGHYRTVTTTTAKGIVTRRTKNAYGQTISVTDGEGRTTSYTYDKNGNLKTVTDAAGTTTNSYDNADRLIEVLDARGVMTRYNYDAAGRVLTEIRDFGGGKINATTTYAYDAKGQQIRVTDARNVVTKIDYDLKGQRTKVIQDFGGIDLATKDITTVYEYRADGKVTKMTEALGKPEQRITQYYYDSMGRLTEERIDPAGLSLSTFYYYDVNHNVVAIIDARNNTTRFVYDKENRQIFSVSPRREVVETGYDAEGRVIWTRAYVNRINQAAYNGFGNEVAEATVRAAFAADNMVDRINRNIYDGDGRRAYAIDAEGYVTGFKYDGADNIKKTVVYVASYTGSTYTENALEGAYGPIDSAPSSASVTSFTYDNVNRLTATTDAENHSEYYQYDAVGNRTRVTNKLGGITDYTYDNLDRMRTEWVNALIHDNAGGQIATGFYKSQFEYDALGNITRQVEGNVAQLAYGQMHDAAARETKFEYDKLSRLTKKTEDTYQGNYTPVENYQYDARGNLIYVEHNGGARGWLYYDADNRKIAGISAVNGTQASYQAWTYDGLGNILTERTYDSLVALPAAVGGNPPAPQNPANYRQTSFAYDKNGRLEARSIANLRVGSWNEGTSTYSSSSGQTLQVISEYNAFGDLVREIDANSAITHHWYDRNGRETTKIDPENYLTVWFRDEDGNVTEERRLATRITGSFTEQSTRSDLLALAGTNGNDRTTTFAYDRNGRRLSETRLGVGSYTVSAGGVLDVGLNNAVIQYGFNALGQVAHKTEANLDRTDYQYDNHGRLTWERDAAITDHAGYAVHRRDLFYYDSLGNVARSVEQGVDGNGNYATGYGPGNDRATLYWYDSGKLISTRDAGGFQRWFYYDLSGRVTHDYYVRHNSAGAATAAQENNETRYDLAGRVTEQYVSADIGGQRIDQGPRTTFAYNAHGEVLTRSLGGVVQESYAYDAAGRVSKSTAGDGVWKYFIYDKNGNATFVGTSAGADLAGLSVNDVLDLATAQENVNATYTVYDKRNMGVKTVEEGRRLSTSVLQNLISTRAYNAFGEVTAETDARNNTTEFVYNRMGRLTRKIAPTVQITEENGAAKWVRPTEDHYYDISGRMVGMRSATGDPSDNLYAATGTSGAGAIKAADKGYLTTRLLLAGTGHSADGTEALLAKEFRPDDSIWETRYDAFRDARTLIDGLYRSTAQAYDKMGRITQITRPATAAGQLIESYSYDGLGQRLKTWNNGFGASYQESRTDYDALGRVVSSIAPGGDTTTTSYLWNAGITTKDTSGTVTLWAVGGWEETSTYANGKMSVTKSDAFGREVEKIDMGGHKFTIRYDRAGRMTQRSASLNGASGQQGYAYYNTGQLSGVTGDYGTATYGYDASGNRISETANAAASSGGAPITSASATYDALNRMITWTETGSTTTPAASTITAYDAVGNIRRTQASYSGIDAVGNAFALPNKDYWYRYDPVNRLVTDRGVLTGAVGASGTTIARADANGLHNDRGADILYNAAGERVTSLTTAYMTQTIQVFVFYPGAPFGVPDRFVNGDYEDQQVNYIGVIREDYSHDAAGRVTAAYTAQSSYSADEFGLNGSVTHPSGPGVLRSVMGYDLLGRMSQQSDYAGNGSTVIYSRSVSYNMKNQVASDDVSTVTGSDTFRTITRNDYDADGNLNTTGGAGYALGSIVWQHGQTYKNSSTDAIDDTMMRFDHVWWDGAVQSSIAYDKHYGWSNNNGPVFNLSNFDPNFTTTYTINGFGQTGAAAVNDGVPKTIAYVLDIAGQVVRRDESRNSPPSGTSAAQGPHEVYYRFAGKQMGVVGNDGTMDTGYDASIGERVAGTPPAASSGIFRGGRNYGGTYADFSQSIDPYNSFAQGSGNGSYTIRAGDSLAGIAAALYGDANLWYKIAEANGLTAQSSLNEGTTLMLPAGITKSTHNASTFMPYDAADALGDTLPTTPKPPKKPKCGVFGQILQTAIAVAVTAITGSPVLGNIASQLFGMATGIQPGGFNWKSLAMSWVSAQVAGGVSAALGTGAMAGSQVLGDVVRGAATSAITQGVGVATGLQNRFSWTGVATAGIGAGVGGAVMRGLSKGSYADGVKAYGDGDGGTYIPSNGTWIPTANVSFGAQAAGTMADAIAQAATRSILKGNSFGDNLIASLPSALGNLVGRAAAQGIATAFDGKSSAPKTAQESANSGTGGQTKGQVITEILVTGSVNKDPRDMAEAAALNDLESGLLDDIMADLRASKAMRLAALPESGQRKQQIVESLATQASAASSKPLTGYAAFDTIDGKKDGVPLESGWATTGFELRTRIANAEASYAAGAFDANVYAAIKDSFAKNAVLLEQWSALADAEVNKLAFAGVIGPAAIAGGIVAAPIVLTGGVSWSTAGALVAVDGAQSALRGYANGSFEMQSTAGGTAITASSRVSGLNDALGYTVDGERTYALATTVAGLYGIARGGLSTGSGYSVTRPSQMEVMVDDIELVFKQNSVRLADEAHAIFEPLIASGKIPVHPKLTPELVLGNRVDRFVRDGNLLLRDNLGLDATSIRINQRLYAPDGKFSIPDIHFPLSGNSIDYSYALKTSTTPQIARIQQASPLGRITIVPPSVIRPVYHIGP